MQNPVARLAQYVSDESSPLTLRDLADPDRPWSVAAHRWAREGFPAALRDASDRLLELLTSSAAWLGQRNLSAVAPCFSPFWRSFPVEFGCVSQKAVLFAVVCEMSRTLRARDATQRLHQVLPGLRWNSDDFPGDLLSVHLDVEALVADVGRTISPPQTFQPMLAVSHGGLRTNSFLQNWMTLQWAQLTDDAIRSRFQFLNDVVSFSPLTQLVYADRICRGLTLDQLLDFEFDRLNESFAPLFRSADYEKEPDRQVVWANLWFSLLARSLLGAARSPVFHEEVRARLKSGQAGAPTLYSASEQQRQQPAASLSDVFEQLRQQRLQRLMLFHAIFYHRDDAEAQRPVQMNRKVLQMRFLDMYVRDVVRQRDADLKQQFEEARELEPFLPVSHIRHTLMRTSESVIWDDMTRRWCGPALKDLETQLRRDIAGQSASPPKPRPQISSDTPGRIKLDPGTWLNLQVRGVFDTGLETDTAEQRQETLNSLADDCFLESGELGQLISRFADDSSAHKEKSGAVAVSFQGENALSFAPQTLLQGWLDGVSRVIEASAPQETSSVSVTTG